MFAAEVDQSKNLLTFAFSQKVTPDETRRWKDALPDLLNQLKPGFKLLSDFSAVESMDLACAPDIEIAMDLLDCAGIAKVVRVIAHPHQDIGFSIMSLFHYRRGIAIVTCQTMEEALAALGD